MRTSGMMEYITPLQIGTESSTVPKSVIKTMVGGYFWPGVCDHTSCPNARITKAVTRLTKFRLPWNALFISLPLSPDNLHFPNKGMRGRCNPEYVNSGFADGRLGQLQQSSVLYRAIPGRVRRMQ